MIPYPSILVVPESHAGQFLEVVGEKSPPLRAESDNGIELLFVNKAVNCRLGDIPKLRGFFRCQCPSLSRCVCLLSHIFNPISTWLASKSMGSKSDFESNFQNGRMSAITRLAEHLSAFELRFRRFLRRQPEPCQIPLPYRHGSIFPCPPWDCPRVIRRIPE